MNIFILIIFLFYSTLSYSRDKGQIEIFTDSGIEVFQKEKYYLLSDNVQIISDDFQLQADKVKAFFNKDLYDIQIIESNGNVELTSTNGIFGKGQIINISIYKSEIEIKGINSSLIKENINMFSNELIFVNEKNSQFKLKGKNSQLTTDNIFIQGDEIDGKYININNVNEFTDLNVISSDLLNIKTETINMFSKRAIYNKNKNIIELMDNVKIIRNNETIIGDYAKINTLTESYKVRSNESKKVKVLINNNE